MMPIHTKIDTSVSNHITAQRQLGPAWTFTFTLPSSNLHPVSSLLFGINCLSLCPGIVTSFRCLKLFINSTFPQKVNPFFFFSSCPVVMSHFKSWLPCPLQLLVLLLHWPVTASYQKGCKYRDEMNTEYGQKAPSVSK